MIDPKDLLEFSARARLPNEIQTALNEFQIIQYYFTITATHSK